jgi:hypothetical protein
VIDSPHKTVIRGWRPRHVRAPSAGTLAAAAMILAAASALATASIDAASITERINGEVIESRPLWLHTFSIAVVTIAVSAFARWGGRMASTVPARAAYVVVAMLNLTVLAISQQHPDFRWVLPILHVALAALLIVLTAAVAQQRSAE